MGVVWFCNPPGLLQESLGPFGPEVPEECPSGCLWGPSGPGPGVSKKCPESVPGVLKRCPGHSTDTLRTLFGHSAAWAQRFPDTPRRTPRGTLLGHFGPEGPRDSCSRSGGLQVWFQFGGTWPCIRRENLWLSHCQTWQCEGQEDALGPGLPERMRVS